MSNIHAPRQYLSRLYRCFKTHHRTDQIVYFARTTYHAAATGTPLISISYILYQFTLHWHLNLLSHVTTTAKRQTYRWKDQTLPAFLRCR